jgi:hypothetical protein
MPRVGFETTVPACASEDSSCLRPLGYRDRLASERAKTVHALDRSANVTGEQVVQCARILILK